MSLVPPGAAAQFRGAWLPPPGVVEVGVWTAFSDNDDWFCGEDRAHCDPGDREVLSPLTVRETSRAVSAGVVLEWAPVRGVAVFAEVPFHSLRYERFAATDAPPVDDLSASGPGDSRLGARIGWSAGGWALSGGYAIRFPTGDFDISAFAVPVGQGTRDHDVLLEVGRSLHPAPFHLQAGLLGRLRETFSASDGLRIDWGNEVHGAIAMGVRLGGPFGARIGLAGFTSGRRSTNIPGDVPGRPRSRLSLDLGGSVEFGAWSLGAWLEAPLAGRDTPADPGGGLSIGRRFRPGG